MFNKIYKNRRVLVTGHTGFKGSWLVLWLSKMHANILGYALEPPTIPNHFSLLQLDNIKSIIGDIRDSDRLNHVLHEFQPEIVFHMAAQSLVRVSYKEPVETFEVNIMGTINVFEACRSSKSVKAIVNITSDKCYENQEWVWGYREIDPMGGYDPYSASKGCAELITNAYRRSFFNTGSSQILLASVRAGNVIGGGDWAEDRLIPDIVKAVSTEKQVIIRNPRAIRPWQHVLEPLSGYLLLGQKLLEGRNEYAEAWNFGPEDGNTISVEEIVNYMKRYWDKIKYIVQSDKNDNLHEASMLKLECSKANVRLKWRNVWNIEEAVKRTVMWYKRYYEDNIVSSVDDLEEYIEDAKMKKMGWVN
jgi:CDP-glucose 4,6-dehydratase